QRNAGIPACAVPERVVVGELAAVRHLVGPCLDLLQAHDVGSVAFQPVAELRLAGANAVDVPGGDLHGDVAAILSRSIAAPRGCPGPKRRACLLAELLDSLRVELDGHLGATRLAVVEGE